MRFGVLATFYALCKVYSFIAGLVVSILLVAAVTVNLLPPEAVLQPTAILWELLHLIGAHNAYIAKQFQTHVLKDLS